MPTRSNKIKGFRVLRDNSTIATCIIVSAQKVINNERAEFCLDHSFRYLSTLESHVDYAWQPQSRM